MSSINKRARRASSPHLTSPLSPIPVQESHLEELPKPKSPRPRSVQGNPDGNVLRPRRSSLKATSQFTPQPSAESFRENEPAFSISRKPSGSQSTSTEAPPLPSFMYTSPSIQNVGQHSHQATPPLPSRSRFADIAQSTPSPRGRTSIPEHLQSHRASPSVKSSPRARSRSTARHQVPSKDSDIDDYSAAGSYSISRSPQSATQSRQKSTVVRDNKQAISSPGHYGASPSTRATRTRDEYSPSVSASGRSPRQRDRQERSETAPSAPQPAPYLQDSSWSSPTDHYDYSATRRGPFRVVNGAELESSSSSDQIGATPIAFRNQPAALRLQPARPSPSSRSFGTPSSLRAQQSPSTAASPTTRSVTSSLNGTRLPVTSLNSQSVDQKTSARTRPSAASLANRSTSDRNQSRSHHEQDEPRSNERQKLQRELPETPTPRTRLQSPEVHSDARMGRNATPKLATATSPSVASSMRLPDTPSPSGRGAQMQSNRAVREESRYRALTGLMDGLGLALSSDTTHQDGSHRQHSEQPAPSTRWDQSTPRPTTRAPDPIYHPIEEPLSDQDDYYHHEPDASFTATYLPHSEAGAAMEEYSEVDDRTLIFAPSGNYGHRSDESRSTDSSGTLESAATTSSNAALFLALGQPVVSEQPEDHDGQTRVLKEWRFPYTKEDPRPTIAVNATRETAFPVMLSEGSQPSPQIVVQPSTSTSSLDPELKLSRSADSISQYSEGGDKADWARHSEDEPNDCDSSSARFIVSSSQEQFVNSVNGAGEADDEPRGDSTPRVPSPPAHVHEVLPESPSFAQIAKTWKSTLPGDAHRSLTEKYGAIEMHRQEVIWELCSTEQAFVQNLRTVLRLFVQPLRNKQQKWIAGVPNDVAKLLDWLDDIVQHHTHVSKCLLDIRSEQYPVVLHIAEALRNFLPSLEVHQPYLVRLESVSRSVEDMIRDPESDFGEFLRIQSSSPECESMPLTSFLLKPAQRLMKYPLFFKQLLELTPRNHPDYLSTFSLLHSTDVMIKIMQEVKARADEYDLIKSLASRICGLPNGFALARRERRLVAQGLIRRVALTNESVVEHDPQGDRSAEKRSTVLKSPIPPFDPQQWIPSVNPNLSKLLPITSPNYNHGMLARRQTGTPVASPGRPESTASEWSTTSNGMMGSPSLTSEYSLRPDSVASSSDGDAGGTTLSFLRRRSPRETQIYAFVFSDLVLLTSPISERGKGTEDSCWKVLDTIGMSRVLGVTDLSGRHGHDHLLSVDLLPMGETAGFSVPVYLSVPDRMTSRMAIAPPDILREARKKWLDAFEKCSHHTLRALCFPFAGDSAPSTSTSNTVLSILSAEQPIAPTLEEEREERSWWSAQFHAVMREMEGKLDFLSFKGDLLGVGLAVEPRRQRLSTIGNATSGSGSGPRPLLLGSKLGGGGLLRSFSRKGR